MVRPIFLKRESCCWVSPSTSWANWRRQGFARRQVKTADTSVTRLPKITSTMPKGVGFNKLAKRQPRNTPGIADGNSAGKAVKASARRNWMTVKLMNEVATVNTK